MATKEDIKRILLLLSVLPNNALREDNLELAIEAYHLVLKDLDWQTLESAAAQHLSTSTFFPTPGNLREAAMDVLLSAQGIPTAGEAWGSVLNARHIEDARYCSERLEIESRANGVIGDEYWYIIDDIQTHESRCTICTPSRTVEDYSHPLVAEAGMITCSPTIPPRTGRASWTSTRPSSSANAGRSRACPKYGRISIVSTAGMRSMSAGNSNA